MSHTCVSLQVKYVSEKLYALRRRRNGAIQELCYRVAPSANELWQIVVEEEVLGTGYTRRTLQAEGWHAVPIRVVEEV